MWGIVPAAGCGSRIQPLAFSKELLPVGSRHDGALERPRAVSEYLIERMIAGGAKKICIVLSPGKLDILRYYGAGMEEVRFCYMVQPHPAGLCDAIFRALPLIEKSEPVIIGLPDTIWFPVDALRALPDDELSFLLFPVGRPELFDAVLTDPAGSVVSIQVKKAEACTPWIWGAIKLPGAVLTKLFDLWCERNRDDEYIGSLINAYLDRGGRARGVRLGESYVDVGTLNGYREAIELLWKKNIPMDLALQPKGNQ
jgi:glucose-1-phosphate thymidylyltransferase